MNLKIGGVEMSYSESCCWSTLIVGGLGGIAAFFMLRSTVMGVTGLLMLSISGVWLYRKKEKLRKDRARYYEQKRRREARREQMRSSLKEDGHWTHIRKFEEKYSTDPSSRQVDRLLTLLRRRGHEVESDDLSWLLENAERERHQEETNRKFNQFRERIENHDPESFDDYIEALLREYGPTWENHTSLILRLLAQRGYDLSREEIETRIEDKAEEIRVERFEEHLLNAASSNIESDQVTLDRMSGYDFERFLADLFEQRGYDVDETKLSGDQGADLLLSQLGETIVVQAKAYARNNNVGNDAVRQAYTAMEHYDADKAWVVTTSGFTSSAQELSESTGVKLVDRGKLEEWIEGVPG